LKVLRARAEAALGGGLEGAVITVPAYFDDAQRQATRDAGRLAGLEVMRLLNEPTAAALAYGLDKQAQGTFAVFDLGGGTFDVTVLAVRKDVCEVVASGGDPFLGGDDMDRAVAHALADDFVREHRVDLRTHGDTLALLTVAGEQIKANLSKVEAYSGALNEVAYGEGGKPLRLQFEFRLRMLLRLRFEGLACRQR
jgi:molecular chaperone DnaK (HSP70)